jgi:hypothetical protein
METPMPGPPDDDPTLEAFVTRERNLRSDDEPVGDGWYGEVVALVVSSLVAVVVLAVAGGMVAHVLTRLATWGWSQG